jgi:hypothetical protein
MRKAPTTVAIARSVGMELLRVLVLTGLTLLLLAWSSSAIGSSTTTTAGDPETAGDPRVENVVVNAEGQTATSETESLTMTIPLDEGGVIDVEAPPMGLKIEKWDGNDVLLIVEKTKRTKAGAKTGTLNPVNIQVSRKGKDVRIETTGGQGWEQSGMDLSFRIVLPDQYGDDPIVRHTRTETAARLTGVLWRALHNEALDWLTR